MRVLVAVASKHGSTREIAETLAEELREQGLVTDLQDVGDVRDLSGCEAIILGSAVYAGNWMPEAKSFAAQFSRELATLPVWLFSSGPLGATNPQPKDDPNRLIAALGEVPARDHHVFVGKLDPETLGFAERLVAKAVRAPQGDFRDWDAIRAWGRAIATELIG